MSAKAASEKAAKASTKKAATPSKAKASGKKETVRVRALKALAKKPMTAAQVQEAIGLGHGLKPTLDQEVERGHLSHAPNEENGNKTTYKLTAKGAKALKAGTVDPQRGAAAKGEQ